MSKKKYSQANFDIALEKIKNNEMSFRDAECEYGVPISTLSNHKNGKASSHKVGPKTVLSFEEEKLLSQSLVGWRSEHFMTGLIRFF